MKKARQGVKHRKRDGTAQRPFVSLNLAMTADGKINTASRSVVSFSSRYDAKHLLELRATADAVMSGARTVDLNPVNLGPGAAYYRRLRKRRGLAEYNLRVIVSRLATVDPAAEIFRRRFSQIIILTTASAPSARLERLRKLGAEVQVCGAKEIDFRTALVWLRERWNVRRLLCEGGGELDDGLFREDLVDELHLTVCPKIFGGRDAPTIADGEGAGSLSHATPMKLKSARRVGDELFLVYGRARAKPIPKND